MEGYVVNENGEKLLAGTRRPDGTIRKERRIRAGYTPQDEQPVYQSGGVMARQNVPKCPGLDPGQASGTSSAAAKTKAAKKNEKRKAKKAEGHAGAGPADGSKAAPAAAPQAAAATQQQQQPPPQQQQQPAHPGLAPADTAFAAVEKQIKALSKKVRQCQALVERQAAGEALSAQEADKVAKMSGWQEEVKELEHQLAKLLS